MNKKEQLQESLSKLVAMTDLPAQALSEVTNAISLVSDIENETESVIKEQNEKIVTLSKAYTDLAIHGKVASTDTPKGDDKPQPPDLDEIGAEIIANRKG